jgi:hypothetical protein
MDIMWQMEIMSRALLFLIRLFTAYLETYQLKQHLDLIYMLLEQLQTPGFKILTVWSSAREISVVTNLVPLLDIEPVDGLAPVWTTM